MLEICGHDDNSLVSDFQATGATPTSFYHGWGTGDTKVLESKRLPCRTPPQQIENIAGRLVVES
jgi:hypothetical protein